MIEMHYNDSLLTALKAGNEQILIDIYEKYSDLLFIKASYMLKDQEAAKDIVQEVIIGLWNKRANINTSVKQYLLTSIHNRCINHIKNLQKQQRQSQEYAYIHEASTAFVPIENTELSQQLTVAINGISAKATRRAFELAYLEGKNHKEIAQEMNTTVETVKKQVKNALKILRLTLRHVK